MSTTQQPAGAGAGPAAVVEHAADEAAGDEVVFSSDGMEPLPVSVRPPPVLRQSSWLGNHSVHEGDDLPPPEAAFQVYAAAAAAAAAAAGEGTTSTTTTFSTSSDYMSQLEGPEQRLRRLELELDSVSRQIETDASLQHRVDDLRARLEQKQQVLRDKVAGHDSPAKASLTVSTTSAGAGVSNDLECLLLRLERAVGSIGSGANANSSKKALLERVCALEQSMELFDPSKLDVLARKAKVIRQDLEAASKARNKLVSSSASSGGGGSRASDDSKAIAQLYDTMLELQGVSSHLPALAQRLQALARVHVDAATWSSRLRTVETVLTNLNTQVTHVERTLAVVEENYRGTAAPATQGGGGIRQQLRDNLRALDERIAKLSQT